jgi:hypothetical protein
VKHAAGGFILVTEYQNILEIISVDSGPGIGNISASMSDGFSTAGTPGIGLGAIKRLADTFDLFSIPQKGTVVFAQMGTAKTKFSYGALNIPVIGEVVSGDAWSFKETDHSMQAMVSDGLGHGILAKDASDLVVETFKNTSDNDHVLLFDKINQALTGSRGAALSIIEVDISKKEVSFAGVGNVTGIICESSGVRRLLSQGGIVGQNMRKVKDFSYPALSKDTVYVLHSDGIATHWDFNQYPGLFSKHPSIIAAVLFRDHARVRDDASIFVFRRGSTL